MAAADQSSPPPPVVQRKQLKEGMQHLHGFVTLPPSTSTPTPTPPTSTPPTSPPASEDADTYGVPSSTLSPLRKPRTTELSAANPEKRTDPFQFGSRYLEEGDDIFAFNAWDHVETDEAYKEFAEECFARQREAPVSEFDRSTWAERYNDHPERQWNKFYANNANNFFKNRKWLHQEYPILNAVTRADSPPTVLLEVGAGAGNTAFPILKLNKNPDLSIYACDFSKTAVDVIRGHEEYRNPENVGRIEASVWDAAAVPAPSEEEGKEAEVPYSLPENITPGSVDIILLIFIFSALSPQQWSQAILNLSTCLKPGGTILFRDYGRGDLAQVRFKKGRWMGENFYVRGDGTRVYFFEEEELKRMWGQGEGGGGFEIESFGVDRRMLVNRQRRLRMYRCWMQAVFRKPGGERIEGKAGKEGVVEKLAEQVAETEIEDTPISSAT